MAKVEQAQEDPGEAEGAEGSIKEGFAKVATRVANATGSVWAFSSALTIVLVWAATGPIFHYSETWQLVINTGTTIITFLMVFVIQHAQNKDMRALHLKLNELIAATEGASNRLIDVEDLTDRELDHLWTRFCKLATQARTVGAVGAKTSVENEAEVTSDGRRVEAPKPVEASKLEKAKARVEAMRSKRAAKKETKSK